jgi:hypothetical protein
MAERLFMFEIIYRGETLHVEIMPYCKGQSLGLQLYDADGLPYSRPSVSMPHLHLDTNMVLIRSDAASNGLLAALVERGMLVDTGRTVPIGYTVAHICILVI